MFSEYAWTVPLEDKNGIIVTDPFQDILGESNLKLNAIRADKSS